MNRQGFIDSVSPERIIGWVQDCDDPDAVLTVEIVLDGGVLAVVTANQMRVDLLRAGVGSGAYGFAAPFPAALSLDQTRRVLALAVDAGGERAPIARYAPPPQFAPTQRDETARPVFVLGSRRSGTSAVTHALLRTRYVGPHEGHMLDLLAPLGSVVEKFYALKSDVAENPNMTTLLRHVPRSHFDDAFSTLFQDIVAKFHTTPFWLDKTPTPQMIRAAPRLAAIWPNARFIFVRRRGFENILSHERKFRAETFTTHCRWWADCMAAWLEVRHTLEGWAIEIDQHMLARRPAQSAELIADLLSLEPHERAAIAGYLTTTRIEQTGEAVDRVEDGMPPTWGPEQRRLFAEICLPLFAPFGYAQDSRYFLSQDEGVAWSRI